MKNFYVLFFFLLAFNITKAQSWITQSSGTTLGLNNIYFTDANTGTAVGEGGTILRTTDGGAIWTNQISGTTNDLFGVSFSDANIGTAVGIGGKIIRTTDGGQSWINQPSGTGYVLHSVSFTDVNNGTTVGASGRILRTTNGGTTWIQQTSGTSNWLWDVQFIDSNNGWAVGSSGTILRTTNGGINWITQTSGTTNLLQSVCFINTNNGWVVGEAGTILITTNGGTNWTTQSSGTTNWVGDVFFIDANNGWTVGDVGTILRTTDGGTNWIPQTSSTTNNLNSVSIIDANNAWVAGAGGIILKYSNTLPQSSWSQQTSGTANNLLGVSFSDTNNGWAVGALGTILRTTNGGTNWVQQTSGTTTTLDDVSFIDANNGWTVGWDGTILRTTNGGTTWTSQLSGYSLWGVSFTDANNGAVVGSMGIVLKTTDGGQSWINLYDYMVTTENLVGVSMIDANNGYAVGNNGTIIWISYNMLQRRYPGTTSHLRNVTFIDANNGWVAGVGTILRTTNGGFNWLTQSIGTTGNIEDVSFTDENNGTAIGSISSSEFFLNTTNGGTTWTQQSSGTSNWLRGVHFIDANSGWAVGYGGTILKYTGATSSVTLTSPNGDEYFPIGTSQNITWISNGVTNVKLDYTTDNGTNWIDIIASTPASAGSYGSTIPNTPSLQCKVRISDVTNSNVYDLSYNVFSIDIGQSIVTLTSPNGGENWQIGTLQNITWTNSNVINVKLDYTTDNGSSWISIITSKPAPEGSYSWTVPNTPSTECMVRVTDTNNSAIGDASNNSFTIMLGQFTEQALIILDDISHGSVEWGDYDNDGDLDILISGLAEEPNEITKIYRNDGNDIFTDITSISLTGVRHSKATWGDYDSDGDLDILLTGISGVVNGTRVSKIYRNETNSFVEQTSISLIQVDNGSAAWGDYDNDGDLDILLTGSSVSGLISKIYKNNGNNTFTEQTSINLTSVSYSSVAWGDYDNDCDLDILLTGSSVSGPISKIYKNNGNNTFTEQTSILLQSISKGFVAWGDYDNDGDLDILLTGSNISHIYRNEGNNSFIEQSSILLFGVSNSSGAWGDYDNDGDLDLLLTGYVGPSTGISKIYRNNDDNTFTDMESIPLTGVYDCFVAWGDYDNDGDLDILLTGSINQTFARNTKIYRNNSLIDNIKPTSPTNLTSTINGQDVTFSWDKSIDNETPQNGLNYNLVIGTTPNSTNILSPMSERTTGFRKVVRLGNSQTNSWTIKGLENQTYYWSVQAIDNNFAGSPFATEQSFVVGQQSPHFTPIWTSNPYTPMNIYVTSATVDGVNLAAGDEIGLFDGANCVGSAVLTEPIPLGGYVSIIASTDDPTTTPVDGFVPGHSITYKLWSASNSREITNVTPTYASGNGTFSSQGTAVVSLTSVYTVTQQVPQTTGWNILSLMATPENPNMLQLLNPLITAGTLIKVQDERGFAVEQLPVIGWINNIGNWQSTEGYYMRVNAPSTLSVEGVPVALPLNIPLTNGWNIIGYPVPTEQNALTVLNPLISANQLIKVQNEAGQAVEQLPVIGWINNIGNFKSGEGYYLKVNTNTSLTLSDPGDTPVKVLAVNEEEKQKNLNKPNADHFVPIYSSPYLPMNIYVTAVDLIGGGSLVAGDEIGVFDGNYCVGSITLTGPIGTFVSIIASTDDPGAAGIDGFTSGHTITYKFWLSSISTEITNYIANYTAGDGTFASQGTTVLSFTNVLPVELTSFTANLNKAQVELKWQTATETNNYGFDVERKTESSWEKIGFVEGNGNSSSPKEYSFTDNKLIGGTKFQYRLKQIDNDGKYEYSAVVEVENIPTEYALYQNYPNPFNPTTKIRYHLPKESKVVIKIYNILGSEVLELLNENKEPGIYEVELNATNFSSGTYIYKISANNFVQTKKMILMK